MLRLCFSLIGVLIVCSLSSAPPYHQRDVIGDLQHEVDNHEEEIRMFEERLNTQENILDSLRQQFLDANLANQELVKGNAASLESRLSGVESNVSSLITDMRQLQSHANDSAKVLSQYKKKIVGLENQMRLQQSTIDSLLAALQLDDEKHYVVQSGDILDNIARKHKTTVKKLKELNGLQSDRIYAGQKIKLP